MNWVLIIVYLHQTYYTNFKEFYGGWKMLLRLLKRMFRGNNLICVMATHVSCHIIINLYLLERLRIGFNEKPGRNIAV